MAVKAPVNVRVASPLVGEMDNIDVQQWTMAVTDTATALSRPRFSDRSVQVAGTFGVGGTITIEGTIDGTTYGVLTDPQGNALSFTTARIEAIAEMVLAIKPVLASGDGTTALTITLIGRG